MREIKFRAWDKKNKWMNDEFYLYSNGDAYEAATRTYDTPNQEIEGTDDLLVMQCTGLKDKNGVSIYEGDIVGGFDMTLIMRCEFSKDDSAFIFNSDTGAALINPLYASNFKVIGNIHEHPELLEQSK